MARMGYDWQEAQTDDDTAAGHDDGPPDTLQTVDPATWQVGDEAWMLVTPIAGCRVRLRHISRGRTGGDSAIVELVGQGVLGTCWLRRV